MREKPWERPRAVRVAPKHRYTHAFYALHAAGLLGQVAIVAAVADFGPVGFVLALGVAALLTVPVLVAWRRFPAWADMTLAMVSVGGFGMVLGWWADLGFQPAPAAMHPAPVAAMAEETSSSHPATDMHDAHAGHAAAPHAPHATDSAPHASPHAHAAHPMPGTPDAAMLEHAGHAHGHHHSMLSWMNLGMLLLGVPAMFLVRHTFEPFDFGRWCCGGMLLIGIPGMVLGMMAGMVLVQPYKPSLGPEAGVVVDYLARMVGMVAGMLIPHALEFALPRTIRTAAIEA